MKKDENVYLEHMLICIEKIDEFSKNSDYESFLKNEVLQNAIIRLISIIGEASAKISNELRDSHTEISWIDIRGMRNRIVHDYFNVRLEVVWNTMKNELPVLKSQIIKILDELNEQRKLDFNDN